MIRSLCACLVAVAFLFSSSSGTMAAAWHHMYNMQSDPLYGVLNENEMVGMAYLKVPFSGPRARRNKAAWGFSLVARLPQQFSHVRLGNRSGMATVMDLRFDGAHVDDLRVNGLSAKHSYRQLSAAGDRETSAWVTYGFMAVALGAAAAVILLGNSQNEDPDVSREPGRALGPGCGDRFGPGAGDGQGSGLLGLTDDRVTGGTCDGGGGGDGTGAGAGDGSGSGSGDGSGDGSAGGT